jgi:hypothetical protein
VRFEQIDLSQMELSFGIFKLCDPMENVTRFQDLRMAQCIFKDLRDIIIVDDDCRENLQNREGIPSGVL